MTKNPFPGPQPYRSADRERFFGRDEVSYRLEGSVLANRCVTVYGPSGAGKSSLMQASVIPALIEKQDLRVVRIDSWPEDKDPTSWLADAVYADLGLGDRPEGLAPADALLAAAQRAARRSPKLTLVYVDQLEQLLYPSRSVDASSALFACLNQLVELPIRNLRVVLSLREDYLGRFRDRLRDQRRVLDHGFRVGPLTVADLCEAVCQAAASGEPPQTWAPEEMRALMLQVRVPGQAASDAAEAQAAFAQIVCRALFQEREQGAAPSGDEAAGEAEPIMRRYFEATLHDLGERRAAAERLLEDHLVTADGSRTLRTEKELRRLIPEGELTPILRALEEAAVLRAEEHQGTRYFELGHDWLARKVHEQRQERRQELEQKRQAADAEARVAKEIHRRRRFAATAVASLVLAALGLTLGGLALYGKYQAEHARKEAEDARKEADRARLEAEENSVAAHDARLLVGFRELTQRGELPWAMRLLLEVKRPAERRGWVELANEALHANPPLVSLLGHRGPLSDAVWSPDATRVLTISDDWTARVFRADGKGKPVLLEGHGGPLRSGAWSPDGTRVVTASDDGTARVWSEGGSGPPVTLSGHEGPVVFASWSPDGTRVVTASTDGTARVWSADGKGLIPLKGHAGALTCAIFDGGGARVLTASVDRTVRAFRADGTGAPTTLVTHAAEVVFLALSPDGTRVLSASRDGTARVASVDGKGTPVRLEGHEGELSHAAWSPDGLRVATASREGTARVWSADGAGEPLVLKGHDAAIDAVAFSPDGQRLATASADRTVRLWDVAGEGSNVLQGHEGPVRSARWSPDGQRLLTASSDRAAKVWLTNELRAVLGDRRGAGLVHAGFFDEKSRRVLMAFADRTARLVELNSGRAVVFPPQDAWISSAALSPGGDRVVFALFDGTARVLRADGTGTPVVLRGHTAPVRDAVFSPDGSRIVTVSEDKTARVFSADGQAGPVLQGHEDWLTSAVWSPDGKSLVTTSLDATARVWKAEGGAAVRVLTHRGSVYTAAWSPDGKSIATASEDHAARIWSADSGEQLEQLEHDAAVIQLAWSPDGKSLATASSDQAVRRWSADGKGEPMVLHVEVPLVSLSFLNGGHILATGGADGSLRAWVVDVAQLTQLLVAANTDCLPQEQRELYLDEPKATAAAQYAACERQEGRAPVVVAEPPRSLKELGAGARRVKLTVLPEDAKVEVDDRPVARRDGFIELTGKVKDKHRIHVWKGIALEDWTVTIEESGPSPAVLDLDKEGRVQPRVQRRP